ncbi:MAG: glycosyltransferase [Lachnospiraceae bacterium]|nr:glycosyltransferase [Lachnospiraceae bacterium]
MNQELKNLQQKYAINLFDWMNFECIDGKDESKSKILVIGDVDDNFIFPLASRVGHLSIVLETEEMEKTVGYLSLPSNVSIYKEFIDVDVRALGDRLAGKKFDYVLIPSLSKKIGSLVGEKLEDIIKFISSGYLEDKGRVLIAFDNKTSFDTIAGAKVEEELLTFSHKDIETLEKKIKVEYPLSKLKVYYPMPEYKFPLRIYSDRYLPKLEDENAMTRNLIAIGKFKEYCNSYILYFDCVSENLDEGKYETIYAKYNVNRTKKFALRTSIIENSAGVKKVIKKAVYADASAQVRQMVESTDLIKNKSIITLKPIEYVSSKEAIDGKAYAVYPFIDGEILTDVILDRIKKGEKEKEVITEYMYKLIGKFSGLLQNYNLDCTFQNVIVSNNKLYVIDSEWVSDDTTEVDFLRFRILKYFWKSSKQYLSYSTFRDMVRDFDISYMDAERYEEAENEFQSRVHENINNLDVVKYDEINPGYAKLYYVKTELERVREQLERITGENNLVDYQTNKQNEIIRLTNVHVFNLEKIIKNLQDQVGALADRNKVLLKREGVLYKIARKLKNFTEKFLPPETARNKIVKYVYRTLRHPFKMLKTYFTVEGRNRIVGDFMIGDAYFECGKVDLPKCDNPKVSIIIPCYNQIRYTYKCLYSIVHTTDHTKIPYEVIVADDVSTDTTRNISKYVDNVVVNRNEINLGFLKNCNAAAKLAKGEYIYFLNNDTELHDNAIDTLVRLLDENSSIGMVGSKLLFADGILQEAGGIIWSDGSGTNYGRGDDPEDFKYNYVREVDYISGASIMIRKNLWNIIGGFDERYTPAYCEDSDLAFEVRKYGYKVVYQPASVVTHFEGVSNGTDENDTSSIKSYQTVNVEKLKEKWKEELTEQSVKSEVPDFFRARERSQNRKAILFIDHYVPTWDKDAGSKTVYSYMMLFKEKGYSVKFMGDNFMLNSPYGEALEQAGIEIIHGNDIQANLWQYLSDNKRNFDFVFLNRPHIAIKYIDFIRQNMYAKIIYYGHDLHYMRLQREFNLMGEERILDEFRYYRSIEYSLLYKADISYYPSYKEIEEIKKIDDSLRVKAINAYMFDEKEIVYRDFSVTKDILFVGGFSHDPNVDAIKWLHESIMPRVRARNKDINVVVVGSNPTEEIVNICNEGGYVLKGFVSDEELIELYKNTRIVIAPLRFGAGIKGKIIEAMANGAAIITTNCGAEGIVDASYFMKITDDAADFAGDILKLYDDFDELKNLSLETQKVINRKFTTDAAWNIIKEDFA